MSRSYKKSPVRGFSTAPTEKEDKQHTNRRGRRIYKVLLRITGDETQLKNQRVVDNRWGWEKDGKVRFDPRRDPKSLRK